MIKNKVCNRCGCRVWKSSNPEYKYQCFNCDEDLYSFEVRKRGKDEPPKSITAAYKADGELEYLTDKSDHPRIFASQAEAEEQLLREGIPADDIKYLMFLEVA